MRCRNSDCNRWMTPRGTDGGARYGSDGLCDSCYQQLRRTGSLARKQPHVRRPEACFNCHTPLVSNAFKGEVPAGHRRHAGHGLCRTCHFSALKARAS